MSDFVPKEAEAMAIIEEEHGQQEHLASKHGLEQEDRLSGLPDDILVLILERIQLREAARTSVLSRRWRFLFYLRSKIVIDTGEFHPSERVSSVTRDDLALINIGVVQATKSMLAPTYGHPISYLRLRFFLVEDSINIIRCVDKAMANREISTLQFLMHPDMVAVDSTEDDMVTYGRRFMRFLGYGPCAFGGLSYLLMHCMRLSTDDMDNVLNTCKKLDYLGLKLCEFCDCRILSVLRIEHPRLTTLTISYCTFRRVDLNNLPRLNHLNIDTWTDSQDQYPICFGYVPHLSVLVLTNRATVHHKTIQLSSFLSNVMLGVLDLDFDCKKIWIQPEAPRLIGPLLQNLQILCLRRIHEECDLDWTLFLLEAAPILKKLYIQVWDHTSCEEDLQQVYDKESNLLTRKVPADFKHYNLKELIIKGYQVHEKFTGYIQCVVEAAVNLEQMILLSSGSCEVCKFSPSTRFPQTLEETEVIKKQVSQWRPSPLKIRIGICS